MTQSLHTLLEALIDYAGLFPPAGLPMGKAVENYARYAMGEQSFALGRFICPVSRLDEFSRAAAPFMPGTYATSGYREMAEAPAWRLSAIIDGPLDECMVRVDAFNEHHDKEEHGKARIETIELKADDADAIDEALDMLPNDITPYFEIATDRDPRGCIAALAGESAGAKIRCGGVRPEAIPPIEALAGFIAACARANVPFKATAGLHHPVRAEQALTYDASPPRAVMHGFVNVFLTSAFLFERAIDESTARALLAENDPRAFAFSDAHARWRERTIGVDVLAKARTRLALGYGSCSFEEPIADMQALGWMG